jgi:hypothetical protein
MAGERALVERVRQLDWHGLAQLWAGIKDRRTADWPAGKAFEHLVLRAFQLDGAEVRWPYEVRGVGGVESPDAIEEIDGAARVEGLWCLIESKDTREPANVEPISKLRNQLLRRPSATVGLLFSVAGFTDPALVLASFLAPQTILLWNQDDIGYCVDNQRICEPLLEKYRICVQEGIVDHNLLAEGMA